MSLSTSFSRCTSAVAHGRRGRAGTRRGTGQSRAAYTVTELVVVVSVMVIGFSLMSFVRLTNPGVNIKSAQGQVAALVDLARVQARTTQGNGRSHDSDAARLVIFAGDKTESERARYLRQVQVVVPDKDSPENKWKTVGPVLLLPKGIYVVPPVTRPETTADLLGGWPTDKNQVSQFVAMTHLATSTASATTPEAFKVDEANQLYFYVPFTARMTLSGQGDMIVLSEAVPQMPGSKTSKPMLFNNPKNVRAVKITQYGNPFLLNDVTDFPSR